MKCNQCESTRIVRNVSVGLNALSSGQQLMAGVETNPDAMVFNKVQAFSAVHANVCADCGFVMLSVSLEDAQRLEDASASIE